MLHDISVWKSRDLNKSYVVLIPCYRPWEPLNDKQNKNHIVGTFLESNRQVVERGKIDTPNTQIHDPSKVAGLN